MPLKFLELAAAVLCACALLVQGSNLHVAAQEAGTVSGRVWDATRDSPPSGSLSVILQLVEGEEEIERRITSTGPDGRFQFAGITRPAREGSYHISTLYEGVPYTVEVPVSRSGDPVQLTIHDAAPMEPSSLALNQALIVREIQNDPPLIDIVQIFRLQNDSRRTLVPEGADRLIGELRALPGVSTASVETDLPGTVAMTTAQPEDEEQGIGAVLRGFVTPGAHDVVLAYTLRYEREALSAELEGFVAPGSARVLLPDGSGRIESSAFRRAPSSTFRGDTYAVWELGDLRPGDVASFRLSGLPGPPVWSRMTRGKAPFIALASILAGTVLAAGGAWYWRRRRDAITGEGAYTVGHRDRLVEAIAELDTDLERGRITERDHRRRRAALMERIRRIRDGQQ